jgi:tetratricopeptide (TPR) repeat protein
MYRRWSLLFVIAIVVSISATGVFSQQPIFRGSPITPKLAAFVTRSPCATADALRQRGLLMQAKDSYTSLLSQSGASDCAVNGLQVVAQQGEKAAELEAKGDAAAAEGDLSAANSYYTQALKDDSDNQDALSGLQKLDQERPDGIRQARDYWNQIVTNTLVPLGQFFLWLLAVFAGIYLLYLLTRVAARWLPVRAMPSLRRIIKVLAFISFVLAAALVGCTVYAGISGHHSGPASGGWWLVLLIASGVLIMIGCLLSAWCLRSGTGVQFSVTNKSGSTDNAACAFLAGCLNSLGTAPPRGFELPEGTDVTSLTSVLTLLPGGGMLSALTGFLLARVQVTPWNAIVTLIDDDQFLVTLHRNGRLVETVLADRESLFFSSTISGQGSASSSAFVQAIDQCGLLTIAAAIILVNMAKADTHSPLKTGLNGATSWESVAGQVLATSEGFNGNVDLSKALLVRATDVDLTNLAARVAKVIVDGRRASDKGSREVFADQMSALADLPELAQRGYEALRLRVLYSSAAGWSNVYLDDETSESLDKARDRAAKLIDFLYNMTTARRSDLRRTIKPLAVSVQTEAYILWTALAAFAKLRSEEFSLPASEAIRDAFCSWEPKGPQSSSINYAEACLEAAKEDYNKALEKLRKAVGVDDDLRMWARHDPSFSKLSKIRAQKFLAIVGDRPPESFTQIGPLAKYTNQLSDIGVHDAGDLVFMTSDGTELKLFAQAVGVSQLVASRWRNIAGLANIPGGPDLGQLNLLVEAGVDSVKALQAAVGKDIDQLVRDLRTAGTYSSEEIKTEDLRRWAGVRQAERAAGGQL